MICRSSEREMLRFVARRGREGASALSIRLPYGDDAMFEVEASRAAMPFICQRAFTLPSIYVLCALATMISC